MSLLEGSGTRGRVEEVPKAVAIVVLSGMLQDRRDAPMGEWLDAADRFEGGIDLFKAGKAGLIIFTGGHVPWKPDARPEGEILRDRAVKLGVPNGRIIVTGKVGNTEQEAKAVKNIIRNSEFGFRNQAQPMNTAKREKQEGGSTSNTGPATQPSTDHPKPCTLAQTDTSVYRQRIILVTSAFHMPRARMLFERQGLEVEPYQVDFRVSDLDRTTILSFIPRAEFLERSEAAIREWLGFLYYSIYSRG